MKQKWTMSIYKQDRRYKVGERLVSVSTWQHRDEAEMRREVRELQYEMWPVSKGFRIEFRPATKMVRNFMTGEMVEIAADTPHCADPSTERYWTM
jgi:hypothetical protein